MTSARWSGCHGVQLRSPFELGTSSGTPITEATIDVGTVAGPVGERIWATSDEVTIDGETILVERELHATASGSVVLTGNRAAAVEIDVPTRHVIIEDAELAVQLQVLATFALPLILNSAGALILHASTCARDGEAIAICGPSGSGKSSALIALIDDGWAPISEDMSAVDLRSGEPVVWPGPPWVRVSHTQPGPRGAPVRFHTPDKTGWDIGDCQPTSPTRLARLVFLDAPAGEEARLEPLDAPAVIPAMAKHAVWLGARGEDSTRLFPAVAELASRVPAVRATFPHRPSWLDDVTGLFSAT
jgi:hypothetical protein